MNEFVCLIQDQAVSVTSQEQVYIQRAQETGIHTAWGFTCICWIRTALYCKFKQALLLQLQASIAAIKLVISNMKVGAFKTAHLDNINRCAGPVKMKLAMNQVPAAETGESWVPHSG